MHFIRLQGQKQILHLHASTKCAQQFPIFAKYEYSVFLYGLILKLELVLEVK